MQRRCSTRIIYRSSEKCRNLHRGTHLHSNRHLVSRVFFWRPSRQGRPRDREREMCHLCTGSKSSGTLAERRRCYLRIRRAWRRFFGVLPGVNRCPHGIVEMSEGGSSSLMDSSLPFQNCSGSKTLGSKTSGSISHRRSATSGVCQSTHPVLCRGVGDSECDGGGGNQFHCGPHYTNL